MWISTDCPFTVCLIVLHSSSIALHLSSGSTLIFDKTSNEADMK